MSRLTPDNHIGVPHVTGEQSAIVQLDDANCQSGTSPTDSCSPLLTNADALPAFEKCLAEQPVHADMGGGAE